LSPQGADPHPLSLREEITPHLPTGIGEGFSQTISILGHAALLRRCELPAISESAELTQGDLSLIHYSEVEPGERGIGSGFNPVFD
jgi:hypothetical protein